MSPRSLWPAAFLAAAFLLAAVPGAAQPADGVLVLERAGEMLLIAVRPLKDGTIGLFLSSLAPSCRFAENVFELPIQVNETGFQLKHAIRPIQRRDDNGSCAETIATSYHPEHYWPLKTATAVTLHLPSGPVPLNEAALAHLKTMTPARPAEALPVDSDTYIAAINRLTMMLSAGQAGQVRDAAEVLLPSFATRPPDEAFPFFALLGTARRMTGDLAFAASSFEVAIKLAAMTTGTPSLGIVYDNLATVRRLQKRWSEAEQASDRAIAALEAVFDPRARQALAGAYNNRALLMLDQEQYEQALVYSDKALEIFKVLLKDRSKELEPFLDDNRQIREKLGRR